MTAAPRNRRQTDPDGVDYSRDRVIDPTENVKALVVAGMQRQDDLRSSNVELVEQHFSMLEKSIDARIVELKELILAHNLSDQEQFNALRREMSQHNADDARDHASILTASGDRMSAMRDLLTASIAGVTQSNAEVKNNVESLNRTVVLNQTNAVSIDTYNEFKKGVETREAVFNTFMLSNQGERSGVKNFWGQIVAAAVGGAALVSMVQFVASHIK